MNDQREIGGGAARVYFIGPLSNGPIKIGRSNSLQTRFTDMQRNSPLKLKVLAHAPGSGRMELYLHWLFRNQWSHGEWFHSSSELLSLIASIRVTGKLPDHIWNGKTPDPNWRLKVTRPSAEQIYDAATTEIRLTRAAIRFRARCLADARAAAEARP